MLMSPQDLGSLMGTRSGLDAVLIYPPFIS